MVTVMPSHHNFPEIFYYLWERQLAPRGTFVDLVFRIVLLQRSLESLETNPNKVNMNEKEKESWTEPEFFALLKVFLVAENSSYIIFDEAHTARCRSDILSRYEAPPQVDSIPVE